MRKIRVMYLTQFSICAGPLLLRFPTPPDHNISLRGSARCSTRRIYKLFSEHCCPPPAEVVTVNFVPLLLVQIVHNYLHTIKTELSSLSIAQSAAVFNISNERSNLKSGLKTVSKLLS